MLTARTDRHRRASSGLKNKAIPLEALQVNLLSAYATERKSRQPHFGSKARGKQNSKGKMLFQQIEFPSTVIKFKNATKESRASSNKGSIMNNSGIQDSKTRKPKKRQNSTKGDQNWTLNPDNYPKNTINLKDSKQTNNKIKGSKPSYIKKYKEAIQKIFKGLDIFNRGTITQTNINKWIPQQALYFLGNIFQRIRTYRLNLTNSQFLEECLVIFEGSSEEDIQQFLESVNGKNGEHVVSIDFSQDQGSPVQMKIARDTKLGNYQKYTYKPLIPYGEIVGESQQKLNQYKLNVDPPKIQQPQKLPFFQCLSPKNQPRQTVVSEEKCSTVQEMVNRSKERVHGILSNQKCSSNNKFEEKQQEPKIHKFEFQIPREQNYSSATKSKLQEKNALNYNFSSQSKKMQMNSNFNFDLGIKQSQNINSRPRTSRIVHQNIHREPLSEIKLQPRINQTSNQKINELTNRLDMIIKQNNEKIDKNKIFIRQNSVPKA